VEKRFPHEKPAMEEGIFDETEGIGTRRDTIPGKEKRESRLFARIKKPEAQRGKITRWANTMEPGPLVRR